MEVARIAIEDDVVAAAKEEAGEGIDPDVRFERVIGLVPGPAVRDEEPRGVLRRRTESRVVEAGISAGVERELLRVPGHEARPPVDDLDPLQELLDDRWGLGTAHRGTPAERSRSGRRRWNDDLERETVGGHGERRRAIATVVTDEDAELKCSHVLPFDLHDLSPAPPQVGSASDWCPSLVAL